MESEDDRTAIVGVSAHHFLDDPCLKSAVQFGCVRSPHPFEDRLEESLAKEPGIFRLPALVLLMRVHAPASVELQWRILQDLRDQAEPGAAALLDDLASPFSEAAIHYALEAAPPGDPYQDDPILEWNARAAGVLRYRRALPALVRLSRSSHLQGSLAAERSLEDFDGTDGDQALAQCLLGWQYDASLRAGRALLDRNKALLVDVLRSTLVPERFRYWQGIFLARAGDPSALPILCETVPRVSSIDREMFDQIEALAGEGDLPLLRTLPTLVRPDQQDRVRRLVEDLDRKFSRD